MAADALSEADVPEHPSHPPAPWGAAALWLGVATTAGHALSYGFSLVLSRELGPAEYGAFGALLNLAVVFGVPATALQTQVARFAALSPSREVMRRGYRLSWTVGLAIMVITVVIAPAMSGLLRIDGVLSMLFLAAGLLPVSVIAARQGVLIGRGSFGLLALTTVLVPALRLAGVVVVVAADMGLAGALGMQAAATWIALVAVAVLVPSMPEDPAETRLDRYGPRLRGVFTSGSGLLGLFVLANIDVLLARVFLPDTESGIYAVSALGAKVVFWGSQFVALLVFPRVARGRGGRRLVLAAGTVIAGVGGVIALVAIPLAPWIVDILVGPAYADAAVVAPWFVVLGTVLALVQLMTYAAVASERHLFSALLWGAVVLQGLLITLGAHGSIRQIVIVCIGCAALLVGVSAVLVRGRRA